MTKYRDDLRRIVGIDDTASEQPDALAEPGGVAAERVVARQSGGGVQLVGDTAAGTSVNTGTGGKENETDEGGLILDDPTFEEFLEGAAADAQTNNGAPNSYPPTAGIEDAKDLIDGNAGPTLKTSSPDNFSSLQFPNNSLKGLNAIDCATGKTLNIRFDGLFVPIEATYYEDGTQKTPAWTDPDTPPVLNNYEQGYYWEITGSGAPSPEQSFTPDDAGEQARDYLDANPSGTDIPPYTITGVVNTGPTSYEIHYSVDGGGGSPRTFFLTATRIDCAGTPPSDPASCPVSPPTYDSWPEDDTISLTYNGGIYQASQFDSDATNNYTGEQNSKLNICLGEGRTGSVEAAIGGGHLVYETVSAGGDATGIVRYYNGQGQLVAFTDSSGADMYRPSFTE